VLLLTLWKNLP